MNRTPPQIFLRFFRWYCHPKLKPYIEGDLIEIYNERILRSKWRADIGFMVDVILLCRPSIIRPAEGHKNLNHYGMFKNYFKSAWRSLLNNKGYSVINVGGLALGMTVAMFIGLWVYDELSFNKYHDNYDRIGQIWHGGLDQTLSTIEGGHAMQNAVAPTLEASYSQYFKHVVRAWWFNPYSLSTGKENFVRVGEFIEPEALEAFSIRMLKGNHSSLDNLHSIIISESTAASLFGAEDPMGKTIRIANEMDAQVTGVYEDIPRNSRFTEAQFFANYDLLVSVRPFMKNESDWDNTAYPVYVELNEGVTFEELNLLLKDLYKEHVPADFYSTIEKYKPFIQVVPMSKWHLYSEFKDGVPSGGRITFVWLFSIVGIFVLILACINFINLSTARSEKRAKEVGVRKTMGSAKPQLVLQFLSESFLVVAVSFVMSLILLVLLQPSFNLLADKNIQLPLARPDFWLICFAFITLTGLTAGVYPAFYLSSFQPVKVLKGSFRLGRFGMLPRKVLVVVQFAVSVTLVIGTVVVYNQVQFARNRPVGYNRDGLITIPINDPEIRKKLLVIRTELLNSGVAANMALSSSPLTAIWNITGGYDWRGKDPNLEGEFAMNLVSPEFAATVGLKVLEGRDFSADIPSDTIDAVLISRAAAKYMGLKDPVGQQLVDVNDRREFKWSKTIIGVVDDMVMSSPYEPVLQMIYYYRSESFGQIQIRLAPDVGPVEGIAKIKSIFNNVVPTAPFSYTFADEGYALKFAQEERVGKLAGVFAVLAIVISCLGLFGLSSFVAEQRTKEIGIRKVMGASVLGLWKMLSKDFIVLVIISCLVAIPIGYYFMDRWLETYKYRTEISPWAIMITCSSAIFITLLTVSYQSLKAASMNPVKSLRSE